MQYSLSRKMFVPILRVLYYTTRVITWPIDLVWKCLFRIPLKFPPEKIAIIDVVGASGKSTMAKDIVCKYGHQYVPVDNCKYGENWRRFSPIEFQEKLATLMKDHDAWVFDGTHNDPADSTHVESVEKVLDDCDLVIWQDYPMSVIFWRKMLRSFKRAIDVVPQGAAREKLHNVIGMLKRTSREWDERRTLLNKNWEERIKNDNTNKYKKLSWPWYYEVPQ